MLEPKVFCPYKQLHFVLLITIIFKYLHDINSPDKSDRVWAASAVVMGWRILEPLGGRTRTAIALRATPDNALQANSRLKLYERPALFAPLN
jgi:hypothetical protein